MTQQLARSEPSRPMMTVTRPTMPTMSMPLQQPRAQTEGWFVGLAGGEERSKLEAGHIDTAEHRTAAFTSAVGVPMSYSAQLPGHKATAGALSAQPQAATRLTGATLSRVGSPV